MIDQAVSRRLPITAVIITKDEEAAVAACLASVIDHLDQVVVVDSNSKDKTAAIAADFHADVLNFLWDGHYPKKKQWGLQHHAVRNDWVLLLDADERATQSLLDEFADKLEEWESTGVAGVEVPLQYYWLGTALRHGYVVRKHVLLHRRRAVFPEVADLEAPGITEVEGHYQPILHGPLVKATSRLDHRDPDPFSEWIARHNRYSDWEAYLAVDAERRRLQTGFRSRRGKVFYRIPLKPILFFLYSYIVKGGYLDRRAGLEYAIANSAYYWFTDVKTRERRRGSKDGAG